MQFLMSEVPLYFIADVEENPEKEKSACPKPSCALLPALREGLRRVLQVLDLYWSSPESGDLWYKSRQSKKTIWSYCEGWWCVVPDAEEEDLIAASIYDEYSIGQSTRPICTR